MTFSGGQVTDYLKNQLLPAHVKLFDGNAGTLNHLGTTLNLLSKTATDIRQEREIRLHFTAEPDKAKLAALLGRIQEPVKVT